MLNKKEPPASKRSAKHKRGRHHFIVAALRAPLKIGGFLPSSRALAQAMASLVDLHRPGCVIELGAGTGVVTNALLAAGATPDTLLVIERDEKLHAVITAHFPHLNILKADAINLDRELAAQGVKKVNAIISSLPLLVMPKPVRHAIQEQMAKVIGEDGIIVQFTYGPRSPISPAQMRRHHLQGRRTKIVMANVPPAHVWVYKKA